MKKSKIGGLASVLLLLTFIALNGMDIIPENKGGEEPQEQSEAYQVVRVVDGDTIIIDMDGTRERVRLIGLDTPESALADEEQNEPYGEIAAEFTKERLEGESVTLEYDREQRDRYNRILAYVYIDGKMFNKTLIEEGHAESVAYPPNLRYQDEFDDLEAEAKENRRGMWGD